MQVPDLNIRVEVKSPGIYDLEIDGATGKTHLFHLLAEQELFTPDKVRTITYHQAQTEDYVIEHIKSFNGELLIVDRLDLYYTDAIADAIDEKDCIVLVDLKSYVGWRRMSKRNCKLLWERDGVTICNS